ncbi:glycosyltransferase [Geomonas oryzae]|uniref:glycosyltransferase n=1 Tax=Geomonas oryzae TaxID=2364273 RepID=UPI00100A2809|nr:glycosyltransferase [Geomonas oryzae]
MQNTDCPHKKAKYIPSVYIASFPTPADDTYYFWLYYEALEKQGYHLVDTRGVRLGETWLEENAGKISIIHFHWPAYIYSKEAPWEFFKSFLSFCKLLLKARSLGYQIAWTVHNIFPHERHNILLEYLTRFCLAHLADVIFVHFEGARHTVSRRFLTFKNIHKIPHGNFRTVFPNNCTRAEARERLGLQPESFVYLIFGPVRPYKGIEEAVAAFREIAAPEDILLVAGNPSDRHISEWLSTTADLDPRIVPRLRFVLKEDVQYYFQASDVVLLPYKKIFTSGNLFLALTFGRPVVCPNIGIMSEVVDTEVGIKYDLRSDGSSLIEAMREIKWRDHKKCCEAALKKAESFTWEEAAAISAMAFGQFRRS